MQLLIGHYIEQKRISAATSHGQGNKKPCLIDTDFGLLSSLAFIIPRHIKTLDITELGVVYNIVADTSLSGAGLPCHARVLSPLRVFFALADPGSKPGHAPPPPKKKQKGGPCLLPPLKVPKKLIFSKVFGSIPKIVGKNRGVFSFWGTLDWDPDPSSPLKPAAGSASGTSLFFAVAPSTLVSGPRRRRTATLRRVAKVGYPAMQRGNAAQS